jgi:hypothetical protein
VLGSMPCQTLPRGAVHSGNQSISHSRGRATVRRPTDVCLVHQVVHDGARHAAVAAAQHPIHGGQLVGGVAAGRDGVLQGEAEERSELRGALIRRR